MPKSLTGVGAGYRVATRGQVAALAEAISCENGAVQFEHFIKGFEGSQVDCAISLEDTVFQGSSPTNRVFSIFDSLGFDSIRVIGIECKDLGPRSDSRGNLHWALEMTKPQWEHAQFIIMSSAYEPGWVVVCPLHYIHRRSSPVSGSRHEITGFRAYWLLHQFPAFPPEFTQFVLPLRLLGEALANIRKFAKDPTQPYINPWNGVVFTDMPVPKASPADILMPRYDGWLNALKPIRYLQRAFRQYSNDFDVELCLIFPMFGDFKIKHRRDLSEVFVEHKSHKLDLKRDADGQISGMRHRPNYNLGKSDRYVFTWLTQWDFLLTTAINKTTGKEEALFLIRDNIPLDWWNDFNRQWLDWPTTSHGNVQEWLIDLDSPEQAVRQIESILNRIKANQKTFKAKGYIPVAAAEEGVSYSEHDAAYIDSLQDGKRGGKPNYNTFYDDDLWTSYDLWKGLGSQETEIRLPITSFFQSERLLELCRKNGSGLIVDVGRMNSACHWGMVDYEWEPTELSRYDKERAVPKRAWHFDSNTPIVPVDFHEAQWILGDGPRGIRDKHQPLLQRSIVVLDLYSPYVVRVSHGRFVIPSDKLLPANGTRYYHLTDEAQWQDYLTDEDEVVDKILSYLSNEEYVRSLGSILQNGLARLATEDLSVHNDEPVDGST